MDQLKTWSQSPADRFKGPPHHARGGGKDHGRGLPCTLPGEGLERDLAWLAARAGEQAVGVAKLFTHIGLKAVDDLAEERHVQEYSNYKAGAIALPESETHV